MAPPQSWDCRLPLPPDGESKGRLGATKCLRHVAFDELWHHGLPQGVEAGSMGATRRPTVWYVGVIHAYFALRGTAPAGRGLPASLLVPALPRWASTRFTQLPLR